MSTEETRSGYYTHQPNPGNLLSRLALNVRKKMYAQLMNLVDVRPEAKILDVGVTNDDRDESNFFEKFYPRPDKITAVGLENASFLVRDFPGLHYVRADGMALPFRDRAFDLVTSFAVIEHVGNRERQGRFVRELCRVGKCCAITTPNRFYPMEVHTLLPFLHWLPPKMFRRILRFAGRDFYAREENLNLLDAAALGSMFPPGMQITEHHHRLLGPISNLFVIARWHA